MKDLKRSDPLDYLMILRRRWVYFLPVFFLVGVGTALYAWRKPDVYRSESRIMVETAILSQDSVRPSDRITPQDQIAAIRNTVQSRSFLEQMIQEFQLFGYGRNENFSMERTVEAVSRSIGIVPNLANTFTLTFGASDAQSAQTVTRRMVQALIDSNTSSIQNKARAADEFIDEHLRQTEQELSDSEEKIKQFKIAHFGELPEQSAANVTALNRLEQQLTAVENDLLKLRMQQMLQEQVAELDQNQMELFTEEIVVPDEDYATVDSGNPSIETLLAEKQAELAELRVKYTPQYPEVLRVSREVEYLKMQLEAQAENESSIQSADELTPLEELNTQEQPESQDSNIAALPEPTNFQMESVKMEINQREKERESLQSQIERLKARLSMGPALDKELMALERERDALYQQFNSLKKQKFQAQMTASLVTDQSRETYTIIDEANLPERPAFPNRIQILLVGLCAGLVLGIGAALGREALDTTVSSEDELAELLKLPVLATISEISKKQLRESAKLPKRLKSA